MLSTPDQKCEPILHPTLDGADYHDLTRPYNNWWSAKKMVPECPRIALIAGSELDINRPVKILNLDPERFSVGCAHGRRRALSCRGEA